MLESKATKHINRLDLSHDISLFIFSHNCSMVFFLLIHCVKDTPTFMPIVSSDIQAPRALYSSLPTSQATLIDVLFKATFVIAINSVSIIFTCKYTEVCSAYSISQTECILLKGFIFMNIFLWWTHIYTLTNFLKMSHSYLIDGSRCLYLK